MDELLKKAADLGADVAKHARVQAFLAARQKLSTDSEALALTRKHEEVLTRIQQLKQSQRPIEPEDKRALAESEAAMAAHPLFKELLRTQTDYLDLMQRVHDAIEQPLIRQLRPTES